MRKNIKIGQRFSRLVVIKKDQLNETKNSKWICKCDCGNLAKVSSCHLNSGHTNSCGCFQKEKVTTHRKTGTSTYGIWSQMVQRCSNPNASGYERYGKRGIGVCDSWLKFENFLADMGERPTETSLDRINGNGNYEPSNCRWATIVQQNNNSPRNVFIKIGDKRMTAQEWSRISGVPAFNIRWRFHKGWSAEDSVFKKVLPCDRH